MSKQKRFDRSRQAYGIYDETDENCLGVFSSIYEVLYAWQIPSTEHNYFVLRTAFSRALQRPNHMVKTFHRTIHVYIIELDEDDDYNYKEEVFKPMKKYVEIQSSINIEVNAGLIYHDQTNPNALAENRLRVVQDWVSTIVLVKKGKHVYPSEIATWQSIKNLVARGDMTIGKELDTTDDADALKYEEKLNKAKTNFKKTEDAMQANLKTVKAQLKSKLEAE